MQDLPLVSVIIPAFNARLHIGAALSSVLDQDYPNLEIIVVDDGSSDETSEEARRYGERVRVIRQANAGPAAARNRGVSVSRGELLAFIDADDVWIAGKLAAQVRYLREHPDVGVVFGAWIRWNASEDGSFGEPPGPSDYDEGLGIVEAESGWIYPQLLLDSAVWIVVALIRKDLWNRLGGIDEALRTGEEYDFFLRASRISRIDKLNRVFACYRIHHQSSTHVVRAENNEYRVLLRAIERYGVVGPDGRAVSRARLRRRLFKLCVDHGYRHVRQGDACVAAKAFRDAVAHWPYSPRILAYFVLARILCAIRGSRNG